MFTVCFLLEYSNEDLIQVDNELSTSNPTVINKDNNILKNRYNPPKGFKRVYVDKGSFGEFLQNIELKNYGEKVIYYNGNLILKTTKLKIKKTSKFAGLFNIIIYIYFIELYSSSVLGTLISPFIIFSDISFT